MADTDPPETDPKKPVTRRRAPRKVSAPKAAPAATSSAKPVSPKLVPSKPVRVAKPIADKPVAAAPPKPASKPSPKPRSTKRSTPRPAPARNTVAPAPVAGRPEKTRGKWGAAAIFSGVAVAGAAVGALLTLRGSTPKLPRLQKPDPAPEHAHQADGTDSSKSFAAGIADPGSVPE